MKKYIIIISASVITTLFFALNGCENSEITRQEFEEAHQILNKKIDSIQQVLSNVQTTTERIDENLDSFMVATDNNFLQGQKEHAIIYDEVRKVSKSTVSFWDLITYNHK